MKRTMRPVEEKYTFEEFLDIMKDLCAEDGCPWDRVQTHESLVPCLMDEAQEVVEDAIDTVLEKGGSEWTKIKNAIRDELGEFLWKRTKRNPMILPILMDAEV